MLDTGKGIRVGGLEATITLRAGDEANVILAQQCYLRFNGSQQQQPWYVVRTAVHVDISQLPSQYSLQFLGTVLMIS